ncbi:high affinity immunoglobulin epsilon receptor subunit gamma, partial [Rana temporaria]|uniref:high affinity immunoglobulin epsilon receptor subunit gamma n=1 Tax=Rana temporaria TaxID=8407 RepID=UPI001AAD33BD
AFPVRLLVSVSASVSSERLRTFHLQPQNPILSTRPVAAKMNEPEVCYILDAILFVYGIVLTALYCHLKIKTSREKKKNPTPALYEPLSFPSNQIYNKIGKGEGGGVEMKGGESDYAGLGPTDKATYETLKGEKLK